MSGVREVRTVTVVYADGETETFDPVKGIYKTLRNNKSHEKDHKNVWLEHEIRWRTSQ